MKKVQKMFLRLEKAWTDFKFRHTPPHKIPSLATKFIKIRILLKHPECLDMLIEKCDPSQIPNLVNRVLKRKSVLKRNPKFLQKIIEACDEKVIPQLMKSLSISNGLLDKETAKKLIDKCSPDKVVDLARQLINVKLLDGDLAADLVDKVKDKDMWLLVHEYAKVPGLIDLELANKIVSPLKNCFYMPDIFHDFVAADFLNLSSEDKEKNPEAKTAKESMRARYRKRKKAEVALNIKLFCKVLDRCNSGKIGQLIADIPYALLLDDKKPVFWKMVDKIKKHGVKKIITGKSGAHSWKIDAIVQQYNHLTEEDIWESKPLVDPLPDGTIVRFEVDASGKRTIKHTFPANYQHI